MRPSLVHRRLRAGAAWLTLSSLLLAGCLSERSSPTGTGADGECRLPLSPDVTGSKLIAIEGFAFRTAEVRVGVGDRVTWVNCEPEPVSHTATADAGAFGSSLLAPGATYTREFPAAGTFAYHCNPHPSMKGTVVVE